MYSRFIPYLRSILFSLYTVLALYTAFKLYPRSIAPFFVLYISRSMICALA